MAKFDFTAISSTNKTIRSTIEATERVSAIASIREQGLKLTNLTEKSASKSGSKFKLGRRKVKSEEIVVFTRQLSAMVSAGVPIIRALNSMAKYAESATFSKAVEKVPCRAKRTKKRGAAGENLGRTLFFAGVVSK